MNLQFWDIEPYIFDNALVTLIFVGVLLCLRWFLVRMIRSPRNSWTSEQRLRWLSYTRTIFVVIGIFGIIYIWAEQVHNLALSIFAIALAVVMATKEIFLCFNGSLIRLRSNAFTIGDRIEVNGVRGDVIDINILSTTLMEVGPKASSHQQTSRSITIPNSMFLVYPIINESCRENFIAHNVSIPLDVRDDWKNAERILLNVATDECAPYLDEARQEIREMEHKHGIHLPTLEPHVWITLPHRKEILLNLRLVAPAYLKGTIEQSIIKRFMKEFRPSPQ
jgi:small-conductance mechanosensitive channel